MYVSPDGRSIAWIEVGILGTNLFVAPYEPGKVIRESAIVQVDSRGGYANWTSDSRQLIYSRLWLGDRFALFANSFDGRESQRITPVGSQDVFMYLSP